MRRLRPLRVTHLLATANVGGVQGSVADLSARLDPTRFTVEAVFLADGPAAVRIRDLGLAVTVLDEPNDAAAVRALAEHLASHRTDVLHAHQFRSELLGARAARLARTPAVVATAHSSRVRSPQDIHALAAETPLLDRLIVPSEAMAAKVRAEGRGGAAITVIPNGVDLHRFGVRLTPDKHAAVRASHGIPADAFLIGVVARLEPEKGHRNLLTAWPTILAAVPNAWLVVVGDGSLAPRLRSRVAAMPAGMRSRITFTGSVADVRPLTASLDVAVLPSSREAQGIAVLEAMAASRPVVASEVGGIPETIRHEVDGLLVPAADAPALAAAAVRLAGDEPLRSGLATAGRRRVEDRFDLAATVRRLTAVYEELAGEGVDRAAALRY